VFAAPIHLHVALGTIVTGPGAFLFFSGRLDVMLLRCLYRGFEVWFDACPTDWAHVWQRCPLGTEDMGVLVRSKLGEPLLLPYGQGMERALICDGCKPGCTGRTIRCLVVAWAGKFHNTTCCGRIAAPTSPPTVPIRPFALDMAACRHATYLEDARTTGLARPSGSPSLATRSWRL
jgi:hypothetical protein